ncbi:MAG: VOC family protein [Planctomycetota bacterium]
MAPELSGGIDHVHVYVADRDAAASWYARVLGFGVVEKYRSWADDPDGPLTIEDPRGRVHLALFASGEPGHDVVSTIRTATGWRSRPTKSDRCGRDWGRARDFC